jgi:hypothetical protein
MFFNKKVWDEFEKTVKEWEKEDEIDNNFGVGISGLSRFRVAAQILSTLVNDEKARSSCSREEATKVVLDRVKILLSN